MAHNRKKARKWRKVFYIGTPIVVVVIAFIIVLNTVIIPKQKQNTALSVEKDVPAFGSTEVGDTISFGAYEQDNDTTNGKEKIEWRVLAKEDSRILVISEKALDCKQYNTEWESVTWETCTLRKWLNSAFLVNAFTTAEQEQIQSTKVSADKNPKYNMDQGNTTTDKVFLLSITEAEKYFSSGEDIKCIPTEYAIGQAALTFENNTKDGATTCWWWLRTRGDNLLSAALVLGVGCVNYSGSEGNVVDVYVRPALWISTGASDTEEKIEMKPEKTYIETVPINEAGIGSMIEFGTYEQDNNTGNGTEPIEWRVLAKEDSGILVISKKALDGQQFNTEGGEVTWETCTLRTWLNDTFLNEAFSTEEQAKIENIKVSADKNPVFDSAPGNANTDKVFLLSIEEAEKYFLSDEDRMCVPTEYAKEQGAWTSNYVIKGGEATCWWWLCLSGASCEAPCVYYDGRICCIGDYVFKSDGGVRPALWINLDS